MKERVIGRRCPTAAEWKGCPTLNCPRRLRQRIPDADAFVFREWVSVVRSASYRILRSQDSVDDVVQRVFEELWRHPERYDAARGPLAEYLAMQGRSRSIDLVRSDIFRTRRESSDQADRHRSSAALDDAGELSSWLECLPTGEREAITLAYLGQLTYREVALQLELPGHREESHSQGADPTAHGALERGARPGRDAGR